MAINDKEKAEVAAAVVAALQASGAIKLKVAQPKATVTVQRGEAYGKPLFEDKHPNPRFSWGLGPAKCRIIMANLALVKSIAETPEG